MTIIKMRPPVVAEIWQRSFWLSDIGADVSTLPLQGAQECDIAIIGGGYTGLWTALRLKARAPQLRITILEADFCGAGASGRNGGQVHSWFAEIDLLEKLVGIDDALMLAQASAEAIDELQQLQTSGTVDMDLRLDGWLWTASSRAQEGAWSKAYDLCERLGKNPFRPLDAATILQRTGSSTSYTGIIEERAGTVQPAKLAQGLCQLALSKGIQIHEKSPVYAIMPGERPQLHSADGVLTAGKIVLATNAWAASIAELHPYLYIVGSQIIATASIPSQLEQIGWIDGASICDSQHHVLYYQRTKRGHVILGRGTGNISYGDRLGARFNQRRGKIAENVREFHRLYPQLKHVDIWRNWCGPIDCTLDHLPVFGALKHQPNIFFGVGFNGTGIAQTPVAGHILASLVLGQDDKWSRCGLVGLDKRRKLPAEPWRYLGARIVRRAIARKNDLEIHNREVGRLTRFLARFAP